MYTGTLGYSCGPGDDRCELTRVGSSTPLVDYSCSPGYTLFDTNKCTATSVGNNSNLSVPSYVQDTSADSWSAYEYALDLPSVASGAVKCFDGSTESYPTSLFPAAGVGVLTQASLGCGGNDTSFPGRCAVKSNNTDSGFRDVFDQPILGRVLTDKQQVVCQVLKYQTHYTSVVPATANSYCKFTRNRYDWNNLETRCRYHRFDYRFNKKAFSYTWNYNDGDYAGYRTATPVYSSSAVDSDLYCSATRPVQPVNPSFTDGAGFTVPSGPTHCAAELAPGTDACPADALRCKLRWGSIGNQRFATFNTPTFDHPRSGHAQPGIGCAVGDPTPQASGDPKNHIGYDNVWADWCWSDPTRQPAHAAYSDPPKLIADIYNPAVPSGDFSGGYWSGVTPNSSDTFTPALHPMKDRGLSVSDIYPPTPAVSFSNFGEAKTDLLKLFKKNGAGGGTLGLQMPQYGDITPLSGALTNALDFLKQVKAADTSAGCRRYSILLVTDGNEDPEVPGGLDTVAAQLNTEGINTYVVGFGIASARLDTFARQVKTAVDGTGNLDLVNGHAYNASDYATLLTALNKIIGDQLNGYYTRSKPTLTSDSKRIYSGYFGHASGGPAPLEYQGYVDAYAIAGGAVSATPDWKFDQKLHAQTSAPHSSLPRRLFTRIPNTDHIGDFDVASACSGDAQKLVEGMMGSGSCGAKRGDANTIIEFVRNDRAAPDDATFGDGTAKYSRVSDVYHSQPAALYAPFFSAAYTAPTPYKELGGGGAGLDPASATSDFDSGKFTASYSAYKASHASRETTVFVGSNTGTVHAIRDDVTTTQTWRGEERWAYVPKQLLPRLGDARTTGHTWLADGSMALAEVCFGKTDCQKADGSGWVAMLIGTTGRGGPFVFGLDVTDVDAPNWLWDYNNDPASLHDTDMGQTWSAPVVARVRVDDDYYKWGVFMGGGYKDAPAEADYFYVLDADPSLRSSYHIQPMEDSHHDDAKFHVPGQNYVYAPWPFTTSVPNNVPGRPRVIRPNDGSRASRVYFGDTNGVIWSMDVTSKRIRDWDPDVLFNPFQMDHVNHGESSCRAASIDPLPDRASPPASLTLSSGTPSMSWPNLNLPAIYNRPYVGLDENTTATMLYVGTGDATNPLDMDTTNFFWAVEDGDTTTTSHCKGKLRWGYFLNKTTGEKVLSEPVVIGKNIIVAVYTPPSGGAGVCGAAGSSMLYCFDRLTGVPQNCLVDLSSSPADSTAATHGGRGRFVRVGEPGIVSDLQAVGNRVVFTTSATPDKLSGNDVANVNSPFRIKSWRRVR